MIEHFVFVNFLILSVVAECYRPINAGDGKVDGAIRGQSLMLSAVDCSVADMCSIEISQRICALVLIGHLSSLLR
jgi:hypothetical protein